MPGLDKYLAVGIDVVVTLPNKRSREMLCYYFNHPDSDITQMKKELILSAIRKHTGEGIFNHSSNQKEQKKNVLSNAEDNNFQL